MQITRNSLKTFKILCGLVEIIVARMNKHMIVNQFNNNFKLLVAWKCICLLMAKTELAVVVTFTSWKLDRCSVYVAYIIKTQPKNNKPVIAIILAKPLLV